MEMRYFNHSLHAVLNGTDKLLPSQIDLRKKPKHSI